MSKINKEVLESYFSFLVSICGFKIKDIKSYGYALYAKFLSDKVGVYFIFEFRDAIPQIQFTLLLYNELEPRVGIYTIKELYKDENFKLKSFYLDEIILFKEGKDYKSYFQGIETIEEAIKISAELVEHYAKDFITGNVDSYTKIDRWLRAKVMEI